MELRVATGPFSAGEVMASLFFGVSKYTYITYTHVYIYIYVKKTLINMNLKNIFIYICRLYQNNETQESRNKYDMQHKKKSRDNYIMIYTYINSMRVMLLATSS